MLNYALGTILAADLRVRVKQLRGAAAERDPTGVRVDVGARVPLRSGAALTTRDRGPARAVDLALRHPGGPRAGATGFGGRRDLVLLTCTSATSVRTNSARNPSACRVAILVAVMGSTCSATHSAMPSTSGTGEDMRDAPLLETRAPSYRRLVSQEDSVVCASSRVKWFVEDQ
jgi:hypothetical protein